jgi:hypothetical protein
VLSQDKPVSVAFNIGCSWMTGKPEVAPDRSNRGYLPFLLTPLVITSIKFGHNEDSSPAAHRLRLISLHCLIFAALWRTTVAIDNSHLHVVADQDGAAILDLERGVVSMLNPIGAHVWQRVQRGDTVEAIVADLAHDTGENIQIIERDIREFVAALKHNCLIQR